MERRKGAIVILSGGQDSTTCLCWTAEQGYNRVHAITFDYGQRHRVELEAAEAVFGVFRANVGHVLEVSHETVKLPEGVLQGTSPLVNQDEEVEKYEDADSLPGGLEKTFVPMRNLLFLTIAGNRAVVHGCKDIIIGVSQEDFGGYPDCRSVFISDATNTMRRAVDMGIEELDVVTPVGKLDKEATVRLAQELGPFCLEALSHSHTCYEGKVPPCGKCHACLLRAKGFERVGIPDPLLERLSG